jgi:hypothetical protein
MKKVRLLAFLSSIVLVLTLSSLAQTSQPSKPEPALPPAQATPQNVAPQTTTPDDAHKAVDSSGRIKIKIVPRRDKKNLPWQLPDTPLVPGVSAQATEDRIQNAMPRQRPGGSFDRGIYLPRMGGTGTMCGSIVSYNFSEGENPILDSVTTCTPSGVTTVRRANGQDQKPAVPQFREIKDEQPKP